MTHREVNHETAHSKSLLFANRQPVTYVEAGNSRVTRRQHKHDMLITFMANAARKRKKRSALMAPKLLKTILSLIA